MHLVFATAKAVSLYLCLIVAAKMAQFGRWKINFVSAKLRPTPTPTHVLQFVVKVAVAKGMFKYLQLQLASDRQ